MQSRQIPKPLRPRERRCRLRAAVLLGVLIAANAAAVSFPGRVPNDQEVPSLAPMLEQVAPAVVSVATFAEHVSNPLMDDPFFRRFFDSAQQLQRARTQPAGSGVIFDARRGYVVTNNHVIDRAEEITVTLSDGRVLLAKLIGVDPQLDLAVLQIGADHLSQVALVDSATRVGDFVVAIGNPFGLGRTVTTGVVSALGRGAFAPEHYEDFIQTDASINSGNSGGALVDLRGDLVGINVAMLAPAGGNVGIGFAIPSTIVSAIASRLIEHGVVQHGSLGLSAAAFNAQLAKSFNVDVGNGVVVVAVEKDSGAARAGIVPGDVIVEIDGHRTDQVADFYARSALVMVGDSVKLTLRRGGKSMTVTIDVAAAYR